MATAVARIVKVGVAEANAVARVTKARAVASVVEARARAVAEAVMTVAVAVAKVVEAWVEAKAAAWAAASVVEARAGVPAVLLLLHREAPSALIVRGMPPVGWAPTFGAESGFWHEQSAARRRGFGAQQRRDERRRFAHSWDGI